VQKDTDCLFALLGSLLIKAVHKHFGVGGNLITNFDYIYLIGLALASKAVVCLVPLEGML